MWAMDPVLSPEQDCRSYLPRFEWARIRTWCLWSKAVWIDWLKIRDACKKFRYRHTSWWLLRDFHAPYLATSRLVREWLPCQPQWSPHASSWYLPQFRERVDDCLFPPCWRLQSGIQCWEKFVRVIESIAVPHLSPHYSACAQDGISGLSRCRPLVWSVKSHCRQPKQCAFHLRWPLKPGSKVCTNSDHAGQLSLASTWQEVM